MFGLECQGQVRTGGDADAAFRGLGLTQGDGRATDIRRRCNYFQFLPVREPDTTRTRSGQFGVQVGHALGLAEVHPGAQHREVSWWSQGDGDGNHGRLQHGAGDVLALERGGGCGQCQG